MNANKSTPDGIDPWLSTSFNCWPLDEHHYAEIFAVCSSIQTDDPPLRSGVLTPTTRAAALRENGGPCLNCRKDPHSLSVDTLSLTRAAA